MCLEDRSQSKQRGGMSAEQMQDPKTANRVGEREEVTHKSIHVVDFLYLNSIAHWK